MDIEQLIKVFREIHENEHKIWFTFEEIEEILKKQKEKK